VNSEENPDVPPGISWPEITACRNGVVTLWRSPDGKNHAWTFDGPIRNALERFARRHGVTFDTRPRAGRDGV